MVGIPRSLGCRNCRRKKKGCDLQRPVCGQCARLGFDCGYDDKRWTFVNQQPASAGPSRAVSRRQSVGGESEQGARTTPPTGSLERSLSRTASDSEIFAEFWQLWMPQDPPATVHIGGVRAVPWVRTVLDLANFDTTVKCALDAVALTIVGRARSDKALLRESTRQYARALRDTNKALQDPTTAQSDAVLACCKTLAMYENFRVEGEAGISSQGFDWHNHVDGTCRIVELRGPARHVADHGHNLFEDLRILAAISSMTRRKPNFFTSHAWHTIPWETAPRNLHGELVDIMITLPDVLAQQDKLTQQVSHPTTHRDRFEMLTEGQMLLARCIHIGNSLQQWERKALRDAAAEGNTNAPDLLFLAEPTLSSVCQTHGYGFFNACMQYWTTSILLYSTAWVVHRSVTMTAAHDSPDFPALPSWLRLPDIPPWMNPRPMAANIAANASYYFSSGAGYWGAAAASMPLGAMLHFCAATGIRDGPEMRQVVRLFEETELGPVTYEFLRSIANTTGRAKGDTLKREEHTKMATSWFRMDSVKEAQGGVEV